jgi:hypothetical protein
VVHDVANGEDIRVRRLHPVVDGDSDSHIEAGCLGQLRIRQE